jgi:hypothetical protein
MSFKIATIETLKILVLILMFRTLDSDIITFICTVGMYFILTYLGEKQKSLPK